MKWIFNALGRGHWAHWPLSPSVPLSPLGLKVWKSTRVSSKRQELVMILGSKLGFWCVFLWMVLPGQGRTVGPGCEVLASAKALRIVRADLEGSVSTGGHQPLLPRQPHREYIEAPGLYD